MPKCPRCAKSVSSSELWLLGEDQILACAECRRPKLVEDQMKKAERRLLTLEVDEYTTEDGVKDQAISVRGSIGGLTLQFDTTVDQIREFFQEKREEGEEASLVVN